MCVPWLAVSAVIAFMAGRWSRTSCEASSKSLHDVDADVQPLLYSPPSGHSVIAVPSVFRDARGAVHNMQIGGFRFNVLVSQANTLRSGDVHRSNQYDMLFTGSVQVTTREHGVDINRTYTAPAFITIPAHVPHIFRSLDATVMAEWWDDAFEARYFRPYRDVVDAALRAANMRKTSAVGDASAEDGSLLKTKQWAKRPRTKERRLAGSSRQPV